MREEGEGRRGRKEERKRKGGEEKEKGREGGTVCQHSCVFLQVECRQGFTYHPALRMRPHMAGII